MPEYHRFLLGTPEIADDDIYRERLKLLRQRQQQEDR
jgi:hypothetical protein